MTTLYCCALANKPPRYGHDDASIVPVLAGAALSGLEVKENLKSQGWSMDDEGESISSLNEIWGDLTVLYWAWRNRAHGRWGVCQYRRKWSQSDELNDETDCLYVPYPVKLCEGSVKKQFELYHGVFPAYDISMKLANEGRIALTTEMLEAAWQQDLLYGCNMAKGPKALMNTFCELTFATMEAFYVDYFDLCNSLQGYQRRSIAFAAERIITAIILHADFFFGKQKIRCASMEIVQ